VVEIEFGDLRARYCSRAGKEYCASGAPMVDNSEDGVIPFTVRESGDEVHSDM